MRVRVRMKARRAAPSIPCPRCRSTDTWKWARDRRFLRHFAHAFGYTLLTCRGCKHEFYGREGRVEGPAISLISRIFAFRIRRVRKPKSRPAIRWAGVEPRATAPQAPPTPPRRPALSITFEEWERRQMEKERQARQA